MGGKETGREKHFVLVHGACHGAWCWYKVATLLKSSGHRVTALDMAASGVHPKQARELNSVVEYVEPQFEFFEGLLQGEKVILVGHSMGGIVISMAMERFPEKIAVAVFVAAIMYGPELSATSVVEECKTNEFGISIDIHGLDFPVKSRVIELGKTVMERQLSSYRQDKRNKESSPEGFSFPDMEENPLQQLICFMIFKKSIFFGYKIIQQLTAVICILLANSQYTRRVDSYMDTEYAFDDGPEKPPTTLLFGYNFMASKLYQLSPPEDLTLASYLARPIRMFLDESRLKEEGTVTVAKYGSVRRVYIVCDEDLVIKEDLQRWMIERNPTDEVCVISNSDHMVMFSKPLEFCSALKQIAENYS